MCPKIDFSDLFFDFIGTLFVIFHHAIASCKTSGCLRAMEMSIRAAPEGSRFPCSQLRSVDTLIPRRSAKASCVRSSDWRTFASSLFAFHALAEFRRWDSGFTGTREKVPSGCFSIRKALAGARSPRCRDSFFVLRLAGDGGLFMASCV